MKNVMYKHNYLNCFGCYIYIHTVCFALNECGTHFCGPQTIFGAYLIISFIFGLYYIMYIWAILYHLYDKS